jgi:hypothetical protein
MEDPEEAIHKAQQAVEVTPQDHPDLVDRLSNQGRRFLPVFIINLRCVRREISVFYRVRFSLLGSLIGRSQRQGFTSHFLAKLYVRTLKVSVCARFRFPRPLLLA